MAAESHAVNLYILGRRIERLFFAGILILIACFVQVYFATASARLAADRPAESWQKLLAEIERDEARLTALFNTKAKPPAPPPTDSRRLSERERMVAETRRKLGLPPPEPEPKTERPPRSTEETYAERLRDIVNKAAIATSSDPAEVAKLVDVKKAPRDLTVSLRERIATAARRPVEVWGIETPRVISLQYGGLDYKIPSNFVATALAAALAPLLIGWLGSLYLTRQRELLLISSLDDYKLAFPHILNLVPVVFDRVNRRLGWEPGSSKSRRATRAWNRWTLLGFRWFLLLLYMLPMIGMFGLATFAFWVAAGKEMTLQIWVLSGLMFVMLIQALSMLNQEFAVLHGKEFFE